MKKRKAYNNSVYEILEILLLVVAMICLIFKGEAKTVLNNIKSINTVDIFTYTIKIILIFILAITVVYLIKRLVRNIKYKNRQQRYINSSICEADRMSGQEFEEFLAAHFKKNGYKVNLTSKTADYGVDLFVTKSYINKNGEKITEKRVVQAKRNKGKIGIAAVQQIIGGMNYYRYDKGMVITNNFFTKNAWELAKRSNVILWDRKKLIEIFKVKEKEYGEKSLYYNER